MSNYENPSNNKTSVKIQKFFKYMRKKDKIKSKIKSLLNEDLIQKNESEISTSKKKEDKPNSTYPRTPSIIFNQNYYVNPTQIFDKLSLASPVCFKNNKNDEKENKSNNLITVDIEYSFSPNLLIKKMNTRNGEVSSNPQCKKNGKNGNGINISKIFSPNFDCQKDFESISFSNYLVKGENEHGQQENQNAHLNWLKSPLDNKIFHKISDFSESSSICPFFEFENYKEKLKDKIFSIKKVRNKSKIDSSRFAKKMKNKFKQNYEIYKSNPDQCQKRKKPPSTFKSLFPQFKNLKLNSTILSCKSSSSRLGMKYNMYSKEEKKFCLELIKTGMSTFEVSKFCEVPHKSLIRWNLIGYERKKGGGRKIKDPELENKLLDWFHNSTNRGRTPNPRQIREKALQISTCPDFLASKGWLEKFKKKNNLLVKTRYNFTNNKIKEV